MSTNNYIFFIIPNTYNVLGTTHSRDGRKLDQFFIDQDDDTIERSAIKVARLGLDPKFTLKKGDKMVQLWMSGGTSDNWQDHGIPNTIPGTDEDYLPTYWPARCFEGMKEGDSLTLTINGHEVTFLANQLDYRYKRFGAFEEALAYVTR